MARLAIATNGTLTRKIDPHQTSRNRASSVIFFDRGGDMAANCRDEQELLVLCLRVLQAALVYVNTLMVQVVLADQEWAAPLTDADRRGLTRLSWIHVAPTARSSST